MVFTMYLTLYILYNTLRFSDALRLFSLLIPVGVFSLVVFHQEFLLSRCLFRPPSASNSPPPVSIKHIQQGIVIVITHLLNVTQKWIYTEQNEQTHVQLGDNSKGADTYWSSVVLVSLETRFIVRCPQHRRQLNGSAAEYPSLAHQSALDVSSSLLT